MMKAGYWIFILIIIFLLLAYNVGAVNILNAFSSFITKLVLFLQGRDQSGKNAGYAK